jgi:hypothetical protein
MRSRVGSGLSAGAYSQRPMAQPFWTGWGTPTTESWRSGLELGTISTSAFSSEDSFSRKCSSSRAKTVRQSSMVPNRRDGDGWKRMRTATRDPAVSTEYSLIPTRAMRLAAMDPTWSWVDLPLDRQSTTVLSRISSCSSAATRVRLRSNWLFPPLCAWRARGRGLRQTWML